MCENNEPVAERPDLSDFEIEPLEERIAPTTVGGFPFGADQGPWVQTGDGLVFLGHDPG